MFDCIMLIQIENLQGNCLLEEHDARWNRRIVEILNGRSMKRMGENGQNSCEIWHRLLFFKVWMNFNFFNWQMRWLKQLNKLTNYITTVSISHSYKTELRRCLGAAHICYVLIYFILMCRSKNTIHPLYQDDVSPSPSPSQTMTWLTRNRMCAREIIDESVLLPIRNVIINSRTWMKTEQKQTKKKKRKSSRDFSWFGQKKIPIWNGIKWQRLCSQLDLFQ